jgi:hypothetical protein
MLSTVTGLTAPRIRRQTGLPVILATDPAASAARGLT